MDRDDPPYRTPAIEQQATTPANSKDAENYNTLRLLQKDLSERVAALGKDFNAFNVLGEGTTEEKKDNMMLQIAGMQIAYDILVPALDAVNSAVALVDNQFLEAQNGRRT